MCENSGEVEKSQLMVISRYIWIVSHIFFFVSVKLIVFPENFIYICLHVFIKNVKGWLSDGVPNDGMKLMNGNIDFIEHFRSVCWVSLLCNLFTTLDTFLSGRSTHTLRHHKTSILWQRVLERIKRSLLPVISPSFQHTIILITLLSLNMWLKTFLIFFLKPSLLCLMTLENFKRATTITMALLPPILTNGMCDLEYEFSLVLYTLFFINEYRCFCIYSLCGKRKVHGHLGLGL